MAGGACVDSRCARRVGSCGLPRSLEAHGGKDALVAAVTCGLADIPPGPELSKECAARRGEIWTIIDQLQQVVWFTEEAVKEQVGDDQHSNRLRVANDLLKGLLQGAESLESYDKNGRPPAARENLSKEYVSIRSCVSGLHLRVDHMFNQLKDLNGEGSQEKEQKEESRELVCRWATAGGGVMLGACERLVSPLLGAASSAVELLGARAVARSGNGLAGSLAEVLPAICEDPFGQCRCVRCRRRGARLFCAVVARSIFDVDPPCRHGPFCRRCRCFLENAVLGTCACRAMIACWLDKEPT